MVEHKVQMHTDDCTGTQRRRRNSESFGEGGWGRAAAAGVARAWRPCSTGAPSTRLRPASIQKSLTALRCAPTLFAPAGRGTRSYIACHSRNRRCEATVRIQRQRQHHIRRCKELMWPLTSS